MNNPNEIAIPRAAAMKSAGGRSLIVSESGPVHYQIVIPGHCLSKNIWERLVPIIVGAINEAAREETKE